MREEVGDCQICGKKVFCLDGFLNGVADSEGLLTCFPCDEYRNRGRETENA